MIGNSEAKNIQIAFVNCLICQMASLISSISRECDSLQSFSLFGNLMMFFTTFETIRTLDTFWQLVVWDPVIKISCCLPSYISLTQNFVIGNTDSLFIVPLWLFYGLANRPTYKHALLHCHFNKASRDRHPGDDEIWLPLVYWNIFSTRLLSANHSAPWPSRIFLYRTAEASTRRSSTPPARKSKKQSTQETV